MEVINEITQHVTRNDAVAVVSDSRAGRRPLRDGDRPGKPNYPKTSKVSHTDNNPILIRVETKSGHGASNTSKNIEITADIYAFLFHTLGVTPNYSEVSRVR